MNPDTCLCQCNSAHFEIVRCDENNRYVYLRVSPEFCKRLFSVVSPFPLSQSGLWGNVVNSNGDRQLVSTRPPAYFLSCHREGQLPGCLFQWDNVSAQCRTGRHGKELHTQVADLGLFLPYHTHLCQTTPNSHLLKRGALKGF